MSIKTLAHRLTNNQQPTTNNHLSLSRFLIASSVALSMGVMACTPSNPSTPANTSSTSPNTASAPATEGEGRVAAQFDLGQTINPADFQSIGTSSFFDTKSFKIAQANTALDFSKIAKATVTMTSTQVAQPATATLTKQEMINGWSFVFSGIPVGNATVVLKVFDSSGKELFSDTKNVEVAAGLTTPVDFVLELGAGTSTCTATNCTGNIKVSVKAVTQCFGRVSILPTIAKVNEPVTVNISDLQGAVQQYTVNYGDGTSPQTVTTLPLRKTYTKAGRYPVTMSLSGAGCKSPFSATGYITIN